MNIVIVSQIFHPVPFRINDIVKELTDAGHSVKVITGLPDYGKTSIPKEYRWLRKRREHVLGADVVRVMTTARRSGLFWRALNYFSFVFSGWLYMTFSKKEEVDAIFCYATSPIIQAIPAIRLKRRSGKKLVLYCLDLWPESLKAWNISEDSWFYRKMTKISSKIYQACDAIPVSSPAFVDYLINVCGVKKERISFLPQHGEDLFSSVSGVYQDNGVIDFLFAGNIGAAQGLETVIQALSLMQTKQPYRFHIVGEGSRWQACQELVQELGLQDKVTFHGKHPLEKMPEFYQMADCFIAPLVSESAIADTIPGKIQSYLSAGKPIIASGGKEVLKLLDQAQAGVGCPENNPEYLALLLDDCVNNFPRYQKMGENGAAYFNRYFTKEVFIGKMLALLEN